VFFSKKLPEKFGRFAYQEETRPFKWDVPKWQQRGEPGA
jgi:hypothetical protein